MSCFRVLPIQAAYQAKSSRPGGMDQWRLCCRLSLLKNCGACCLAARHGLSATEIDDLVDILSIQAELLEPALVEDAALRDRNDLPVLGTLLAAMHAGNIDYLITGDKDLLALAERYPVVTPAEFWARHGSV